LPEPLIPKHGGYRKLKSFQVAELVYDVTVRFCNRYIGKCGTLPIFLGGIRDGGIRDSHLLRSDVKERRPHRMRETTNPKSQTPNPRHQSRA